MGMVRMTGKRFTVDEDGYFDKINHRYVTIDYLMDLVNRLDEENKQFRIEKDTAQKQHSYELDKKLEYKSELIDLKKENQALKRRLMIMQDKVKGLMK